LPRVSPFIFIHSIWLIITIVGFSIDDGSLNHLGGVRYDWAQFLVDIYTTLLLLATPSLISVIMLFSCHKLLASCTVYRRDLEVEWYFFFCDSSLAQLEPRCYRDRDNLNVGNRLRVRPTLQLASLLKPWVRLRVTHFGLDFASSILGFWLSVDPRAKV